MTYEELLAAYTKNREELTLLRAALYHTVTISDTYFALVFFSADDLTVKVELLVRQVDGVLQYKSPVSKLPLEVVIRLGAVAERVLLWKAGKYLSIEEALNGA
jgi:hypothetical protein